MRVLRRRNQGLYHSDGFGMFVEIESMSRLFFSWCCMCDSEQYLLPRGIEISSGFSHTYPSPAQSAPKIMLFKTNYKFSFDLSLFPRYLNIKPFTPQVLNLPKHPNAQIDPPSTGLLLQGSNFPPSKGALGFGLASPTKDCVWRGELTCGDESVIFA